MDHGSLTDNNGRKADFRNIILVMTTNAGAEEGSRASIGFTQQDHETDSMKVIEKGFSPEFRNRLDAIIQFKPLDISIVGHVVDKFIFELEALLAEKHVTLTLDADARLWLAEHGCDPKMGARPMARLIQEKIKKPLANDLLFGKLANGGHVRIYVENNEMAFAIGSNELLVSEVNS
jgi:ATP-dependent Clp protease ATP-binding subunit ClpA